MVTIKKNSKGESLSTYENSKFGYMTLESTEFDFSAKFVKEKSRTALYPGETEVLKRLEAFINNAQNKGQMPGRITVSEFIESEVPEHFSKMFNKNLAYVDQIAQYAKKAGKDGPALTVNGEVILRFTEYDTTGTTVDTKVQHNNYDDVAAYQAARKAAEANI